MIIPQIAENLKKRVKDVPDVCPVCREKTEIRKVNNAVGLTQHKPECQAKRIKSFALFASRDALNIDGMSEAT